MSRVVSNSSIQLVSCVSRAKPKRAYTVAAENVKAIGQAGASVAGEVVDRSDTGEVGKRVEKQVFWMKDPKTGNWMPETHFNEVDDAAELRAKFLSKKP